MGKIGFIISKKNLEYNTKDFYCGKEKILYIIGLSGSGKTTLGLKKAKENNAILLELDNLGGFFGEYKNSCELMHKIVSDFLNINIELKKLLQKGKYMDLKLNHFEDYIMWNRKYIKFIEEYVSKNEGSYIIEGTHLFMTIEPKHFIGKPLIVVRTGALKSLLRRISRQLKSDEKKHPFTLGRKHLKKLLNDSKRLHYKDVKKLNSFLNKLEKMQNIYK